MFRKTFKIVETCHLETYSVETRETPEIFGSIALKGSRSNKLMHIEPVWFDLSFGHLRDDEHGHTSGAMGCFKGLLTLWNIKLGRGCLMKPHETTCNRSGVSQRALGRQGAIELTHQAEKFQVIFDFQLLTYMKLRTYEDQQIFVQSACDRALLLILHVPPHSFTFSKQKRGLLQKFNQPSWCSSHDTRFLP